jgi:pyruvate dehydrogenase E2 component (dihydrolipoamide acetyltransferase)
VRKLAKDLGVDLAAVVPTGPDGTITRDDVQAKAAGGVAAEEESPPAAAVQPGERETRVAVKGVRKMTAQAMVASAFTAPHVTEWITVDATRSMKLVARLRRDRAYQGVKVSPLLLVARAVCLAARRTPEVNASWDEAAQEIVLKHYVNLGIAAATPRGLIVPSIKDADSLSALDLAKALADLTAVARSGKTQPADMAGGTFTITNVGVFGVDSGTPILNPGESAILAMGAIRQQPWVVRGKIKVRWITTLAVSFDHRIVDGEQGSRFLSDVARIIEDPSNAILV